MKNILISSASCSAMFVKVANHNAEHQLFILHYFIARTTYNKLNIYLFSLKLKRYQTHTISSFDDESKT